YRTLALRAATAGPNRSAATPAEHSRPAAAPAAGGRKCRQARHRTSTARRSCHGGGPPRERDCKPGVPLPDGAGHRRWNHRSRARAWEDDRRRTEEHRTPARVSIRVVGVALDSNRPGSRHDRGDPSADGRDDRARGSEELESEITARLRVVVADDERPARSFLIALLRSFK